MTYTELKELLENKISEAKEILEKTENGDKLYIRTSVTYMVAENQGSPSESEEFVPEKTTLMLGNLIIRASGHLGEEDPEFYYTIAMELSREEVAAPEKLEKEYLDFDSRLLEFTEKLKVTEDAYELVLAEYNEIEEEARQAVAKLEASLKALKKRGLIIAGAVFALFIIILILKEII